MGPDHSLVLIRMLLEQHRPQSVLQVGLGQLETLVATCQALRGLGEGQLTLVDDRLHNDLGWRPQLRALRRHALDDVLDLIGNAADRALPDFYFQEQCFDLVIFVPGPRSDENVVALYYLDRLLAPGAPLLVLDADTPSMKGVLRQRLEGGTLAVASPGAVAGFDRLWREGYQRLPTAVRGRLETWVHPERLRSDESLGIAARHVLLNRVGESESAEPDVDQLLAELSLPDA